MLFKRFPVLIIILLASSARAQQKELHEGDVIFQSNVSDQCKAIELATHSKFSHCGLLFKQGDQWMVLEAVQPVSITSYNNWIARNKQHHAVKRLKNANAVLTPAVLAKMKKEGKQFIGKNYDSYFGWSNDRIYCSELVWKVYKAGANLELGKPKPMKEYDLSSPLVKNTMKERYGNKIPLEELMISPGDIYNSPLLETIVEQ